MSTSISGLHHITGLASDPQKNVDFYAGVLGLRLLKKTINFDAVDVYHLYYGDETGSPGTIMTFFPYPDLPKGRKGNGQLTVTSFSIAANALDYWMKRLTQFHIPFAKPFTRFDDMVIAFEDHDGTGLELVANTQDARPGFTRGHIPPDYAIKGFYGITLAEESVEKTERLQVTQMNYSLVKKEGNRFRYSPKGESGNWVDIVCCPEMLRGSPGYGTIHHVAFATPDDTTQVKIREKLSQYGLSITPVIDREYFHSIYFRESGGVLFEVATPASFTKDELLDHLGESLQLPPWEEYRREQITQQLPSLQNRGPTQ